MDSKGNLYVSDYSNNRIVRFDDAANKASGASANGVIGQSSWTSSTLSTQRNGLQYPSGIFVDSQDRLWVADKSNHRVLRYDNPDTLDGSGGVAPDADAVIGQASWTGHASGTTRSSLDSPSAIFVDSSDRLWLLDQFNARILRFDNAGSLDGSGGTAPEASAVIGQASFTTNSTGESASLMSGEERGLWLDEEGNLWVSDTNNHRVLRFSDAATLDGSGGTAPEADLVLGQADFTSRLINAGNGFGSAVPNGMYYPQGVGIMDGRLLIGSRNNRILGFDLYPMVATSSVSNVAGVSASSGGNVTDDLGKTITARGVCWNTSGSPTIQDSCTNDGSGAGSFSSTLSGLSPNTTYYVRAYATNSAGTGYGTAKTFTTSSGGGTAVPLSAAWALLVALLLLAVAVARLKSEGR